MQKKIRILHCLCSNQYSGAENVVCQIIAMFRDSNQYEFIYSSPDGPIRRELENRSIQFCSMNNATTGDLRKVINSVKPDIVHAHDMKASFLAAAVCKKIPLISHIHNNNFDSRKVSVKSVLYRYAAHKANHIFWVSASAFEGYRFHKGLKEKSTVLYNVIDINALQDKAEMAEIDDSYDIVFLGRITYPKNPERVLEIIERLQHEKQDLKAAIIGTGDLENDIHRIILEKGLENNVHCLGFMSNPYGILRNCKAMILASRWEGTPMCALEAMSLGVPIVTTPTDGMRELVETGKNGYVCSENDELVKCCMQLIQNEKIQKTMSQEAVLCAQKLMDIDAYKCSLKTAYDTAIK